MTQRKQVYEKEVHMCQMGLVDRVSGDPHKKSTAVQMNHPVILTEVFPERKCDHPPGAHQPIEGHVRIWDEQQRRYRQVRRSTLAAEWTPSSVDGFLMDWKQFRRKQPRRFIWSCIGKYPSRRFGRQSQ